LPVWTRVRIPPAPQFGFEMLDFGFEMSDVGLENLLNLRIGKILLIKAHYECK